MSKTAIYLDYAAATPLDPLAQAAMQPYLSDKFYNPSAVYQAARSVRQELEAARGKVADVLGAKDQEIVFTAGGTEANNLAITGILSQFPEGEVLTSTIEHESVLEPARHYSHRELPVSDKGVLQLQELSKQLTDKTVLISVMYANNEVGTIQPLKELMTIVQNERKRRQAIGVTTPLYVHTDACQASNYLDLQVARLGIDLMTVNGSKIYAPKQSGCLYVRSGVQLKPLIQGGGQEAGLRSGTENVGNIIAFATMLQVVQKDRKAELQRISELRNNLYATLSQKIPTIILNGDVKKCLPNNVNITIPGVDGERLLLELDEAGLLVATGSACSASSDEPSHVLLAMGRTKKKAAASLRLTLGRPTTAAEVRSAAEILVKTISAHRHLV